MHHVEVQSGCLAHGTHEPVNRSVTATGHGLRLPGIEYVRDDAFARFMGNEGEPAIILKVFLREKVPELIRRKLAFLVVSDGLDDPGKLYLQGARQLETVFRLQNVATPPLPDWELMRITAS